jgi:transglutaminase-like putative cysteine protease
MRLDDLLPYLFDGRICIMKRMRIIHKTGYFYNQPVKFGPHRAMMRPREGHDAHIARPWVKVEPRAEVSWLRDTYDNSIAILTFHAASDKLSVESEVDVDLYYDSLNDGEMLHRWLQELYQPGQVVNTLDLLNNLNSHIYKSFKYDSHDALGVQLPNETLTRGSGTCRDFAVFMMEAARYWGFGARFVTGYIQLAEGPHGATHAWTEIYISGAGWRGFDPTNNKLVGSEHIPVGVSREQEKASPFSGSWEGPVSVQVVEAT